MTAAHRRDVDMRPQRLTKTPAKELAAVEVLYRHAKYITPGLDTREVCGFMRVRSLKRGWRRQTSQLPLGLLPTPDAKV